MASPHQQAQEYLEECKADDRWPGVVGEPISDVFERRFEVLALKLFEIAARQETWKGQDQ